MIPVAQLESHEDTESRRSRLDNSTFSFIGGSSLGGMTSMKNKLNKGSVLKWKNINTMNGTIMGGSRIGTKMSAAGGSSL